MQKNKFVHENIKAVCNRAMKKLAALGLAVAVGGTCTIGGSCNRVVSAQTPPETSPGAQPAANEFQQRIDNLMRVRRQRRMARGSQFWTAARLDGQEAFERRQIAENPEHLNQLEDDEILYWGASPIIFGNDVEVRHHIRRLESQIENERALRITAEERANALERRQNQPHTQHTDATHQMIQARENQHIGAGTGNRQTITGNTMLQVQGTNHVEAWSDTHIHSLSNNELLHEGGGAVNVDRDDIIISDFSNGQTARDVTINEANSVTIAPGTSTRIQNGTEFTIGRTAQETLENLQHAMGLIPDNRQPMAPSNIFVRFFSGLVSVFTYILFGRWLGGSGGSK